MGGKGISAGTGKGVNPVEGMGIEPAVVKLAGVFGAAVVLDWGIWETEGTAEDITEMGMILGGAPDDATTLGFELAGGARSLRARTQGSSANQCQPGRGMTERESKANNLHCKSSFKHLKVTRHQGAKLLFRINILIT